MEFKIVKKGYDKESVDKYISKLVDDYEERLSLQKDRIFALKDELDKSTRHEANSIFSTLLSTIERAKQVESSTKKIFELESKRLSLTYLKLQGLIMNCNDFSSIKDELISTLINCKKSLDENIKTQNITQPFDNLGLENKLQEIVDSDLDLANDEEIDDYTFASDGEEINENAFNSNETLEDEPSNLLSSDETNEVEIKIIKKDKVEIETKLPAFDLREAINPKEDLDEIMKAFDFYNDNKKTNKN